MVYRSFVLLAVFFVGCARLAHLPMSSKAISAAELPSDSSRPEHGDFTQKLDSGRRVAIYLENGRRIEQILRQAADVQTVLDAHALDRNQVVAITLVPRDRLLDGVLIGAGTGAGVGLGWGAALSEGDLSREIATGASIYGLAAGAGLGAMIDAGIATPERPIVLRQAPGQPASSAKRWSVTISPQNVAGWIVDRNLELMLRDGTYMKGKAVRGSAQSVELAVRDSSNKSYKGRSVEIEADRISTIVYRENTGGNRFAAALGGALTGLFTGALAGGSINYDAADETQIVVGAGIGTVLGTGVGWGMAEHHNWREITLIVK